MWIIHRYLKVNFEDFKLHELDCKFDVILVEPPLEEYQREAAGATFNWKPWSWEEVRTGSPLSVHECYRLFVPLDPNLLIVCTPRPPYPLFVPLDPTLPIVCTPSPHPTHCLYP